jgi:transposase
VRQAQIFVAVMGASSFTYVEATWTQTLGDWIGVHTRALAAIGGVPRLIVPDNANSCTSRRSTEPMPKWRRTAAAPC